MRAMFDNLLSLEYKESYYAHLEQVADTFIAQFPVLQARATKVALGIDPGTKDLQEIQELTEREFIKREKIPYLLNCEAGQKMLSILKDAPEDDRDNLARTWAYLRLHRRCSKEQLVGWLTNYFKDGGKLIQFVETYSNKLWLVDKRSGWFTTFQAISEEESFNLDLFQSSLPMIVPPRKLSRHNLNAYYVRKTTCWTKKAMQHRNLPYESINRQNSQRYRINYDVWEKFKFSVAKPVQEIGESDEDYTTRCKSIVREHWRKAFVLILFKKLGIKHIWIPGIFDHRGRLYAALGGIFNTQGQDQDKALFSFDPVPCTEVGQYWLAVSIANNFNCKYKGKDLDKLTYDLRHEWYEKVIEPCLQGTKEEFEEQISKILPLAESPACFWTQTQNMFEIIQAKKNGEVPMVYSITHWDATSSGFQFQCMFSGDMVTGKQVNISSEKKRYDLYTTLHEEVEGTGIKLPPEWSRKQLKKTIWIPSSYGASKWQKELEKMGYKPIVDAIKKVMEKKAFWPLNRYLAQLDKTMGKYDDYFVWLPDGFQIAKRFNHHEGVEVPILGEKVTIQVQKDGRGLDEHGNRKWSTEYLTVIVHSCDAYVLRELDYRANFSEEKAAYIRKCLAYPDDKFVGPDLEVYEFLKVMQLAVKYKLLSYRLLFLINRKTAGIIRQDPQWMQIVCEMLKTARTEQYNISCIHDSFGVIPNFTGSLMENYKQVMAEICQSNWLSYTVEQLTRGEICLKMPPASKEMVSNIKKSEYMLC